MMPDAPAVPAATIVADPIADDATRDRFFAALAAQVPAGVVVVSRDGTLRYANEVARAWFAAHATHAIDWVIARVLLTGEVVRDEEIELSGPRREWHTLSVSATPVADGRGEITDALVAFVDVTDRNRGRDWEPTIRALCRL